MTKTAGLLTIGLVTFITMVFGAWRLAGLNPWVSLGVAAAFCTSTLAAVMLGARSNGQRFRTRRRRGVFMFLLGLAIVGCGVFAWYFTPSRVASVVCLLSGIVYTGLGVLETVQSRRPPR